MKPAPTPKKELTVYNDGVTLKLIPSSQDALGWLSTEAPRFGEFVKSVAEKDSYWLIVSRAYDLAEVAAYLDSYNDVEEEDVSP
jgi:hypothetical protein